jgi:xanthine dehydrogenase accessory factor
LIPLRTALQQLAQAPAVLVTVLEVQGSVPRGQGTCMLVFAEGFAGTIGGGHLEFQALAHAHELLAGQTTVQQIRHVLGPSLGQCCGGTVALGFERVTSGSCA